MTKDTSNIASQTAAAATISGHLYRASIIAKRMALAAKNSRAMVLRAGAQAAGLKVISDYFDELAGKTIKLSGTINQCAISISQNSVRQWRTNSFLSHVNRTKKRINQNKTSQLNHALNCGEDSLEALNSSMQSQLSQLNEQLIDIRQYMQSSSVVAVTFRLEATQTGDYQPLLEHMANTIDGLSNDIKHHITFSQNQLSQFKFTQH
ncbi:hypothetical protein QNI23_006980 [Bermanella sp. WJH001]|uniref:hypothetical protein n=1 Tax=Bermanella sp. WJH001 TaxID=3048005 RepID=UPI0024BE1A48|nr:hypothetical protein [Bermanella sp. WJH001]MDJ1536733.1 hypothetical protein [Bermanella sp. WJH001]